MEEKWKKEQQNAAEELLRLLTVMQELRSEHGCPWDKEQTHQSLKRYLIEETYETVEAIEQNSDEKLCEELGDVLLQVVFHAQIATEEERFTFADVAKKVTDKMVFRHPHVFQARTDIKTADDVLKIWEVLKEQEHAAQAESKRERKKVSVVDVPRVLPALLRAQKMQEKASRVGFDWPNIDGALEKLMEEIEELKQAKNQTERLEEFGDVLFSLVNIGRFLQIDSEDALSQTNEKFLRRFAYIEEEKDKMKKEWHDFTLEELDVLWEKGKSSHNL